MKKIFSAICLGILLLNVIVVGYSESRAQTKMCPACKQSAELLGIDYDYVGYYYELPEPHEDHEDLYRYYDLKHNYHCQNCNAYFSVITDYKVLVECGW